MKMPLLLTAPRSPPRRARPSPPGSSRTGPRCALSWPCSSPPPGPSEGRTLRRPTTSRAPSPRSWPSPRGPGGQTTLLPPPPRPLSPRPPRRRPRLSRRSTRGRSRPPPGPWPRLSPLPWPTSPGRWVAPARPWATLRAEAVEAEAEEGNRLLLLRPPLLPSPPLRPPPPTPPATASEGSWRPSRSSRARRGSVSAPREPGTARSWPSEPPTAR